MSLIIATTLEGKKVIAESSEAHALGLTPVTSDTQTKVASTQQTQGGGSTPTPQQTGTISHPVGGNIDEIAKTKGGVVQNVGGGTTYYHVPATDYMTTVHVEAGPPFTVPPATATATKLGQVYLQTGYQQNPFTGQFFKMIPMKSPEQAAYENTYPLASIAYEKAIQQDPLAAGLLNLGTLWSARGFEYMASYLPGSVKKPDVIVKEQMTESLLTKNIVEPWKIGNFTVMNTWIARQTLGSITNTPTGVLGISLLAGEVVGVGANIALSHSATLSAAANYVASAAASHSAESLLIGGTIIGSLEAAKIQSMQTAGFRQEQIIGEIGKDAVSFAGFSEGFRVGLSEGNPFKFMGKTERSAEEFVNPKVLSGVDRYSSATRSATAEDLLKEFRTSPLRYIDEEGGFHTKVGNIAPDTLTGIGSSEHPGFYISPDMNLAYLRINGAVASSVESVNPNVQLSINPKAIWLRTPVEISNVPEPMIDTFLMEEAGTPKAFIFSKEFPMIKIEKQAIVPPFTRIVSTSTASGGFTEFITIKDIKVPIMPYEVSTGGVPLSNVPDLSDVVKGMELASKSSYAVGSSFISMSSITSLIKPSISISAPSSSYSISYSPSVSPVFSTSSSTTSSISMPSSFSPAPSRISSPSSIPSSFASPSPSYSYIPSSSPVPSSSPAPSPSMSSSVTTGPPSGFYFDDRKYFKTDIKIISRTPKGIKSFTLSSRILPTASMYSLERSFARYGHGSLARGPGVERTFRNLARSSGLALEFPAAEWLKEPRSTRRKKRYD